MGRNVFFIAVLFNMVMTGVQIAHHTYSIWWLIIDSFLVFLFFIVANSRDEQN
jgi:hypothetical protein